MGSGRRRGRLRPRGGRPRHRICRRGDRYRLAALAGAQAAARRRGRDHGLRDAGAAARPRCWREMERTGVKVERATLAQPVAVLRPDHRPARGRDQRAGRRGLQYRLAQAARRDPVRQDEPARRPAHQDRGVEHRRARRSKSWRPRATSCRARCSTGGCWPSSRAPIPTRCRPTSIPRRAACTPPTRWPRPPPGGCRRSSRTCRTSRCARPEGRAIRKAFVAEQGQEADLRRLQPDRASRARPHGRHADAAPGLRRRARHPRHDRVRDVRRADRRHGPRTSAARPRPSISASSTASHRSGWPPSSASAGARPAPISRPISSASPASATTWRR